MNNEVLEILDRAGSIAITGHLRPDGDCTGACLGLYNYIKDNYPDTKVDIFLEKIEDCFEFLKSSENILHEEKDCVYDVFFILDCGNIDRTAGFVRNMIEKAAKTVCLDHHVFNGHFADVSIIKPEISSACEVLSEYLDFDKISEKTAECLYTGMIHDTGVFKYQSVTHKTMDTAGKLMEKGIPFTKIIDDTFFKKTYAQNLIMAEALLKSKLLLNDKIVYSYISLEEMKQYNVSNVDLGGIIDQLRFTKGIEVALFLYECADGKIKGSFRAVNDVDVNVVASVFGGGGHMRAAGFTTDKTVEEIIQITVEEFEKVL